MASLNLMLILNIYCIVHLLDYSLVFPLREPLSVRKSAAAHFYSFFRLFSLSLFSFFKHFSLSLCSWFHSSPGNRRPGSETNSFSSLIFGIWRKVVPVAQLVATWSTMHEMCVSSEYPCTMCCNSPWMLSWWNWPPGQRRLPWLSHFFGLCLLGSTGLVVGSSWWVGQDEANNQYACWTHHMASVFRHLYPPWTSFYLTNICVTWSQPRRARDAKNGRCGRYICAIFFSWF